MAKTYTSVPNVATGDVYTASTYNTMTAQNINNLRVPPMCWTRRTTNLTGYTAATDITWESALYDTESPSDPMWSSGSATRITVKTAGIYSVTFTGIVNSSTAANFYEPRFFVNGSVVAAHTIGTNGTIANGVAFTIAATLVLAATDYITCRVDINGGSSYSITGSSTIAQTQTRCVVAWLGQVS